MHRRVSIAVGVAAALVVPPVAAGFESTFLYALSDTTGRVPYAWASISWDSESAELYVVSGGLVDVFSDNGMAIYGFANDTGYGPPQAIAADPSGDLYAIATRDGRSTVIRCNYRGEPLAKVDLSGVPAEFAAEFQPDAIAISAGKLYVADKGRAKLAIASLDGVVSATRDFPREMALDARHREDASMRAFAVDAAGNILFTAASLFSAYVASPEGKVRSFGQKGSSPGKFGTVAGIASDGDGHIFVSDTLRSAVLAFDAADFRFLGEFGGRGGPGGLVAPLEVAAWGGKVYVTQSVGGIKVFGVQFD